MPALGKNISFSQLSEEKIPNKYTTYYHRNIFISSFFNIAYHVYLIKCTWHACISRDKQRKLYNRSIDVVADKRHSLFGTHGKCGVSRYRANRCKYD